MKKKTEVHFFSIKDASAKLKILSDMAAKHLEKKEILHIMAADRTTLTFVDELLWKEPPTGFIPHGFHGEPSQDTIVLTLPLPSFEGIHHIFNLTSQPLLAPDVLKIIYEFEDLTHPAKKALFDKKFHAYQEAGFTLCSMDLLFTS